MAISKLKLKKLEMLMKKSEYLSADICKSRGLKGTLESNVFDMHSNIVKASGKVKSVREAVNRRELMKKGKFNVDELNPDKL